MSKRDGIVMKTRSVRFPPEIEQELDRMLAARPWMSRTALICEAVSEYIKAPKEETK